jgi:hypothetical protein
MLQFRDFVPRQLQAPHFGLTSEALQGQYETLEAALGAANEWLGGAGVRIVNVETVVLPNLWAVWEEGSHDPVLSSPGGSARWFQFIRVWFEEKPGP